MNNFAVTEKNRVKRRADRGRYDKSTIYEIIDEAIICHIGFIQDERPFVIPALHARLNDELFIHGSSASRLLHHLESGKEVSVGITIVDGIVLAKTVFNHSINYRSVVLFGKGRLIQHEAEKLEALECFTERLLPGQWKEVRKPSPQELKATSIVSIPIQEASAKLRTGPPGDDGTDRELRVWAGVLPIRQVFQTPVPAQYTDEDIPLPEHIGKYISHIQKITER